MENEEPPGEEPPLFGFIHLFIFCIFVLAFIFYPFKACLGLFFVYATYVGYSEDKLKTEKRRLKRRKPMSLEKYRN